MHFLPIDSKNSPLLFATVTPAQLGALVSRRQPTVSQRHNHDTPSSLPDEDIYVDADVRPSNSLTSLCDSRSYVQKVCQRAKFHYTPETDDSSVSVSSDAMFDLPYWKDRYKPLHPKLENTMYFV
jgi:hypothetical protein